jgi:hypothetical protein
MRWLISAVALVLVASAAAACINDREVDTREREFKSQYLAPRPTEPVSPEPSDVPLAAAGGGLLLLTLAAVVASRSA